MFQEDDHKCSGKLRLFDIYIEPPRSVWAARGWLCEVAVEEYEEKPTIRLLVVDSKPIFLEDLMVRFDGED